MDRLADFRVLRETVLLLVLVLPPFRVYVTLYILCIFPLLQRRANRAEFANLLRNGYIIIVRIRSGELRMLSSDCTRSMQEHWRDLEFWFGGCSCGRRVSLMCLGQRNDLDGARVSTYIGSESSQNQA